MRAATEVESRKILLSQYLQKDMVKIAVLFKDIA